MIENDAPAKTRVWLTVLLCCIVSTLEGYDLQVIGVAALQLTKELGLSPRQNGTAFSASLVGLALGSVVSGRLADRMGRKPLLLLSVAIFGVFSLATAAANDFASLLGYRFLTGVGLGGSMPNVIAIVSEVVPRRRITLAVAGMSCGLAFGGVVVSQLARWAPGGIGWRELFVIGGILPLVLLPLLWKALPETLHRHAAVAREPFWTALFGAGRARATISLWIVFALTLLQLSLLLNWLPTLVLAKGMDRSAAFSAILALNVGSIVGSLCLGWLCDRFGAAKPMLVTYVAMAMTMLALSAKVELSTLLVLSFFAGFTVLGAQFALYGLSPRVYQEKARASGVGAAVAAGRVGAILGPLIAGSMLSAGASGDQVILYMVPLVVAAAVAMFVLSRAASDRLGIGVAH